MKQAIFSWAIALLISGCGGGSYGTGVRDLNNRPFDLQDRSERRSSIEIPWLHAVNCRNDSGSFRARTEFGLTRRSSSSDCSALIPMQANVLIVEGSPAADAVYRFEKVDCFGVHSIESEGTWRANYGQLRLPTPRWRGAERYLLIVSHGTPEKSFTITFYPDVTDVCSLK